jgi:hypothetical protein
VGRHGRLRIRFSRIRKVSRFGMNGVSAVRVAAATSPPAAVQGNLTRRWSELPRRKRRAIAVCHAAARSKSPSLFLSERER